MASKKKTAATSAAVFSCIVSAIFVVSPNLLIAQQAKVRDVRPGTAIELPNTIKPVPKTTPSINEELFNQLQILQQEVLELRGQIEQQTYDINKLKQQRLDDYLDLDRRIGEINQLSTSSSTQSISVAPKQATASSSNQANVNNNSSDASNLRSIASEQLKAGEDEKVRYRKAIDQVLKQQDYESAQAGFSDYLSRYPKGYYTPNVYYWQGEIFLLQDKTDGAVTAFTTLIDHYPNHSKVPDAKYKLAKVYFQQGKKDEAKTLLEAVVQSATDASRLAQSFLDSNY